MKLAVGAGAGGALRALRYVSCWYYGVPSPRHWTTLEAAQRFEAAARAAEVKRDHRSAAALYRAALLVLTGQSLADEVGDAALLDSAACGDSPHPGASPCTDATSTGWRASDGNRIEGMSDRR